MPKLSWTSFFLMRDSSWYVMLTLLPGRTDITTDKRTNAADIPTFDLDWSWMMKKIPPGLPKIWSTAVNK
ncbi:MAG: hypothetical protein ACLUOI_10475 [Eisenbergiella sp.]